MVYLRPKELKVFKIVQALIKQNNKSPSIREICILSEFKSPSSIHRYLDQLQKRGVIEWETGKPRTLQMTSDWSDDHNGSSKAKLYRTDHRGYILGQFRDVHTAQDKDHVNQWRSHSSFLF